MNFTTPPTKADLKQFDVAQAALETAWIAVEALRERFHEPTNLNEYATLTTMPGRLRDEHAKLVYMKGKVVWQRDQMVEAS